MTAGLLITAALRLGLLAGLLSSCGGGGGPTPGATGTPCPSASSGPAEAPPALPTALPTTDGQTLVSSVKQGATRVWFVHVAGDDVVAVRDALQAGFSAAGFTNLVADAEPPAEAELQFAGPLEGSIQVTPLCDGRLQVRYRVSG